MQRVGFSRSLYFWFGCLSAYLSSKPFKNVSKLAKKGFLMRRKTAVLSWVLGSVFLLLASTVRLKADTIYTNLGSGQTFDTTQASVLGHSSNGNTYVLAYTFVPTEDAMPTDVLMAIGLLARPQLPPLNLYIESSVDGSPGSILNSFSPAGNVSFQASLVQFNCSSCLQSLTAGTTYWLVAQESNPAVNISWYYTGTANHPGGSAPAALNKTGSATGPWVGNTSVTTAFQVNGTATVSAVPEPGTWLLVGSGIFAVALLRSRDLLGMSV